MWKISTRTITLTATRTSTPSHECKYKQIRFCNTATQKEKVAAHSKSQHQTGLSAVVRP